MMSIKYRDATLALINPAILAEVIKDYSGDRFMRSVTGMVNKSTINEKLMRKAMQFEKAYTTLKKKKYRSRTLRRVDPNSKNFQHFIKAIKIIEAEGVTYNEFLKAQIEGLKFVNDGKGTFPSPAHLSTSGAVERLMSYLADKRADESPEEFVRIKLTKTDSDTPLMENPNFVHFYKKLKKGKANLKEAHYVLDCMIARKKERSLIKEVEKYISELESDLGE